MKIIKTYESFNIDELDLGRFSKVIKKSLLIPNTDGTFDYNGNLDINQKQIFSLLDLPVKFKNINGNFNCSWNFLKNLDGSPEKVSGDFACTRNHLISLEGASSIVSGHFNCIFNNLISLRGAPLEIDGDFSCYNNNLLSKEFLTKIKGNVEFIGTVYSITQLSITDEVIDTVSSMSFEQQMAELDFFEKYDSKAFEMMKEVLNTLGVNYGPETRNMIGVMNKDYTNAKNLF